MFIGRLGPLQRQFNPFWLLNIKCKRRLVNRDRFSLLQDLTEIIDDSLFVEKRFFLLVNVVDKLNSDPSVNETCDFQVPSNRVRVKVGSRKNRGVRRKRNRRSRSSNRPFQFL